MGIPKAVQTKSDKRHPMSEAAQETSFSFTVFSPSSLTILPPPKRVPRKRKIATVMIQGKIAKKSLDVSLNLNKIKNNPMNFPPSCHPWMKDETEHSPIFKLLKFKGAFFIAKKDSILSRNDIIQHKTVNKRMGNRVLAFKSPVLKYEEAARAEIRATLSLEGIRKSHVSKPKIITVKRQAHISLPLPLFPSCATVLDTPKPRNEPRITPKKLKKALITHAWRIVSAFDVTEDVIDVGASVKPLTVITQSKSIKANNLQAVYVLIIKAPFFM